jgi:O-antigen ligase
MNDRSFKFSFALVITFTCMFLLYVALSNPGYLADVRMLGGLIFLELLAAILWNYRQRFFLALILAFLWAGTSVPLQGLWASGRWVVLAAGAIGGIVIYLREPRHHFGLFHLMAFGCVLTAIVSALVSTYPQVAVLKAASLFLLFLYGATGARLAVMGREAKFFSGLLLGCELLVYLTGFAYFVLRLELFGNRNSLGVVMGVVAWPILLWGLFESGELSVRRRRTFALVLCLVLLLGSYARAAIAAASVSSALLCFGLRRYRLLFKGAAVALLAAILVAAFVPIENATERGDSSLISHFIYKGQPESGIWGSRTPVWDRTISSLREHPWFGTGFGTSSIDYDKTEVPGSFASAANFSREHGNSYLAITEWVGLLGIVPFLMLLLVIGVYIRRVVTWMRRGGNPVSPAVPLAAFVAGALVHAGFEDWLFAVGYHTCVLFWALAFMLPDLLPAAAPQHAYSRIQCASRPLEDSLGVAASAQ